MWDSRAGRVVDAVDLDLDDAVDVPATVDVAGDDQAEGTVLTGQAPAILLPGKEDGSVAEVGVKLATGQEDLVAIVGGDDEVAMEQRIAFVWGGCDTNPIEESEETNPGEGVTLLAVVALVGDGDRFGGQPLEIGDAERPGMVDESADRDRIRWDGRRRRRRLTQRSQRLRRRRRHHGTWSSDGERTGYDADSGDALKYPTIRESLHQLCPPTITQSR